MYYERWRGGLAAPQGLIGIVVGHSLNLLGQLPPQFHFHGLCLENSGMKESSAAQ